MDFNDAENQQRPCRMIVRHCLRVPFDAVYHRVPARRPLLGLPLTQNHRRLRHQWYDERRIWAAEWNEVVFTDESRICLQRQGGRIRVWRHRGERMLNSCVMHRVLCSSKQFRNPFLAMSVNSVADALINSTEFETDDPASDVPV
ncbi:transposable element Tcb1 transposase [Trichonephila clavipes]|nr:transposable element Tcb1 transposase [Trichonephila clavipes]